MPVITIGNSPVDRATYWGVATFTLLDIENPAPGSVILDTIQHYTDSALTGCKVGTFTGSGASWHMRDYETLGDVASGSLQTFTGLSISAVSGDVIGVYFATGNWECDNSGGSVLYSFTENFDGGTDSYSGPVGYRGSFYGTGEVAGQVSFYRPYPHILAH